MYLNHRTVLKKDLSKLLVAPKTGGIRASPPAEQEEHLTLPELLPLLMWSRLKRRQQPPQVTLKKRMKKMNGLKAAGMCVSKDVTQRCVTKVLCDILVLQSRPKRA